jgi:hypothetical protein
MVNLANPVLNAVHAFATHFLIPVQMVSPFFSILSLLLSTVIAKIRLSNTKEWREMTVVMTLNAYCRAIALRINAFNFTNIFMY